jgi:hypothetical protein
MRTRSIIARATGEGKFQGRYHHWDGYPNGGVGTTLVELCRGFFKRDLDRMLRVLLDEHTGWSTIVHKNFKLKPGYTSDRVKRLPGMDSDDKKTREQAYQAYYKLPDMARPQCYCHGARSESDDLYDETSDCNAEWAYVFETVPEHDEQPEQKILHVLYPETNEAKQLAWKEAGRIDLNSEDKIDWEHIECGADLERCSHYAWVHFPQLKGLNLGTQKFLGREPMELRDAIGFIIDGKRVKNTGSGGDSDYLNRSAWRTSGRTHPPNTWIQTVVYGNGRRADIPVALRTSEGTKPFPGVKWIFPPTLVNPKETVVV